MESNINRRRFMESAAATGVFTIVPRHVLGGAGFVPPSDKITLAQIGTGSQGLREFEEILAEPQIQVVAVCDPNLQSEDYIDWGKNSIRNAVRKMMGNPNWGANLKGIPGGREVGRQVVDAYYANQRGADKFRACAAYADFRELLDKEKDLDAVKIMTPDHLHAYISIAAMKKGKHVMVHKPISNRMSEFKMALDLARKTKLSTHLLAFRPDRFGPSQAIADRIKEGVIGPLRALHSWGTRPVWPQYTEIPADRPPVPPGFDWDLWLGPSLPRPYHPHYTHNVFRGWYEFGGGSIADTGIYGLWPVFTALELGPPITAKAWSSHTCGIIDHVTNPTVNDFAFPTACKIQLQYAARGNWPAMDLIWYEGGMQPELPKLLEAHMEDLPSGGTMYVGDKGVIFGRGQVPQVYTASGVEPLFKTAPQSRETEPLETRIGIHKQWVAACRGGALSPGNYLNAIPISETVCLTSVALRAAQGRLKTSGRQFPLPVKLQYDSASMKITNVADANKFLYREYRPGWEL